MNRLLYNRAIVNKLSELIEKYPHWRFGQLLINCDIITILNNGKLEDPFYKESIDIWNKMIKNKFCFNNENLQNKADLSGF